MVVVLKEEMLLLLKENILCARPIGVPGSTRKPNTTLPRTYCKIDGSAGSLTENREQFEYTRAM